MESSPSMLPMSELMAAPITPDDLDFDLDSQSANTMNEFEAAWKQFMEDNPDLIPEGKREKKIKELQNQARGMNEARSEAVMELQKQLDFFEKSRQMMEKNNQRDIDETLSKQAKMTEQLQKKLRSVAMAEHLLLQTYPWQHFLESVDEAAMAANISSEEAAESGKNAKPSARALYLVDDSVGDVRDIELRAYQIDNALLATQIKMLQKEAEAYENLQETQELLKTFLNESGMTTPAVSN